MSKLLRYFAPGQMCFVTSVTYDRQPILVDNAHLLLRALVRAKHKSRFSVVAWVVLPDHFHAVLETPKGDTAKIIQRVKLSFARQYRSLFANQGRIWQRRYWDHIIRSKEDLNRHINYIHYNPIKHGLSKNPNEWFLSSFSTYFQRGFYETGWGNRHKDATDDFFGE